MPTNPQTIMGTAAKLTRRRWAVVQATLAAALLLWACRTPKEPAVQAARASTAPGAQAGQGVTPSAGQAPLATSAYAALQPCGAEEGRTLYVDGDGDGDGDGGGGGDAGNPGKRYRSVQAAIDAAQSGDSIFVAAGTYRESIVISGKSLQLCGGFDRDFAAQQPMDHPTVLQGSDASAVVRLADARNTRVVGFEIGSGQGGVEVEGGAPMLANNLITGNTRPADGQSRGGGVFARSADLVLIDNVIAGNSASRGGGVAITRGGDAVRIEGNIVERNIGTGDHGGGLYIHAAHATLTRNTVRGNEVGRELGYGWGGGIIILNPGAMATLTGNVVTDNLAASAGSGTFVDEGARAVLERELIYANRCGTRGGVGLYIDGGSAPGDAGRTKVTVERSTIANHDCPSTDVAAGVYVSANSELTLIDSYLTGHGGRDFTVRDGSVLVARNCRSDQQFPGAGPNSGRAPSEQDDGNGPPPVPKR